MKTAFTALIAAASLTSAFAQTTAQPAPDPGLSSLKQFHGHWKGDLDMGGQKFVVDMNWRADNVEKWNFVDYTFTSGKTVMDYRVIVAKNPEAYGLNMWMIGAEYSKPEPMKGEVRGGELVVLSSAPTMPEVRFTIENKSLVMRIVSVGGDTEKEVGKGVFKKA